MEINLEQILTRNVFRKDHSDIIINAYNNNICLDIEPFLSTESKNIIHEEDKSKLRELFGCKLIPLYMLMKVYSKLKKKIDQKIDQKITTNDTMDSYKEQKTTTNTTMEILKEILETQGSKGKDIGASGFSPPSGFYTGPHKPSFSGISLTDTNFCDKTFKINYDYVDITLKLMNSTKNKQVNVIQKKLEQIISDTGVTVNFKDYFRFNPSLIKLSDSPLKFLVTYRIYMGHQVYGQHSIGEPSHFWKTFWRTLESNKLWSQNLKTNLVGLAILDSNLNVEKDMILLDLKDGEGGIEDVRLYKDSKNDIYITGYVTKGASPIAAAWGDTRYLRLALGKLGQSDYILNNFDSINPSNINFSINCLSLHQDQLEKNWFLYSHDNKDYVVRPPYGTFFPLEVYNNQDLDGTNDAAYITANKTKIDEGLSQIQSEPQKVKFFNELNNITKCTKAFTINPSDSKNFPKKINNAYLQYTNNNKFFRFSGGSSGIEHNGKILFVGHIVIRVSQEIADKNSDFSTIGNSNIKSNLQKLLSSRKIQLCPGDQCLRYYCFLFELDPNINEITRISHGFNVFGNEFNNTQINFPIGLDKNNNNFYISLGESDAKCIIVKVQESEIDKLMVNTETYDFENYKLLTFDSVGNILC